MAVHADVRLPGSWTEFVRFAAVQTRGKRLAELKYLIAAYAMYVADGPAHLVCTPFPGGYTVELHKGYITVRCVLPRVKWMRLFAGSVLRCRAVSGISCLPAGSVSLWNAGRNWRTTSTIITGDL